MKSTHNLIVEILRGDEVESLHEVSASVADSKGQIIQSYGQSEAMVYPRSAIKMIQAIPFVESGAYSQIGSEEKFLAKFLAMACASHRGQKEHIDCLDLWMKKTNIGESDMVCQGHLPSDKSSMIQLIRSGIEPTQKYHNCAGKHLALLTTAQFFNEELQGYEKYEHPAQERLRNILTEAMGLHFKDLPYGIDGCGIPTYSIPLNSIARGMSIFINSQIKADRRSACGKILAACQKYPVLISGENHFTTVVNEVTQGRVIVKVGAEGNYCGVLVKEGLSFAIKAKGGEERAAEAACAQLIQKFAHLTLIERHKLHSFLHPMILSSTKQIAGKIRVIGI